MPPSLGPGRQPKSGAGAFAIVTTELVHTTVELANRQVEAAQLRRALASRVWIEQANGMVAATQGSPLMRRSNSCGCGCERPRASWPRSPRSRPERPAGAGRGQGAGRRPGSRGRGARPGGRTSPAGGRDRAGPTHRSPGPDPRCPCRTRAGRRPTKPHRRPTRPGCRRSRLVLVQGCEAQPVELVGDEDPQKGDRPGDRPAPRRPSVRRARRRRLGCLIGRTVPVQS